MRPTWKADLRQLASLGGCEGEILAISEHDGERRHGQAACRGAEAARELVWLVPRLIDALEAAQGELLAHLGQCGEDEIRGKNAHPMLKRMARTSERIDRLLVEARVKR